ncbi:MAG: glycosyltransferase family 4 protein [Porticoccaceae bacterium]|jgi:UDP-glucose:(heptosyl)LPS alpha-1,3-glucosyltransferase
MNAPAASGPAKLSLAFLIYRYFPYGGQQRNMLTMAREAAARGHRVTALCHRWEGDIPDGVTVVPIAAGGIGNHARLAAFARGAAAWLDGAGSDLVVGFIKLPGLDAYYAADPCFAEKAVNQRSWVYRLSPRTRTYLAFEQAVFGRDSATHILEVSPRERPSYIAHYGTQPARFHTLVPGIARNRRAPDDHRAIAANTRAALGFGAGDELLLALGSGFRTKGLDRSIRALGALHRQGRGCHLLVVGEDRSGPFRALASREGVADHVHFLGGRDDVPAILQAADLLLHPAYRENTGNALLEAMVAGLPVIATRTCGYSHYVADGDMGLVIDDDSTAGQIAGAVRELLAVPATEWHRRGALFAESADIYRRPEQAIDILESLREDR